MSDNPAEADEKTIPGPVRKQPAHGVLVSEADSTIVFVTVCTKDRKCWLASAAVHERLRSAWCDANAWLVGRYVVMPDHIHLFASPTPTHICLDDWIQFWKSRFSKKVRRANLIQLPPRLWQTDHWDTRLRNWRLYDEKWNYVRNNPVRHGLVARSEDWPFQGELHSLTWD
jgi:putative transposase